MAQVSRAIRKSLLLLCPRRLRTHLLHTRPNLRKAAPSGMKFVYFHYLSDLAVNIDTTYKVERIMWTGVYEQPLIRLLEKNETAGWSCFDVGANVGAIALALAKFIGIEGKVYAFEPGLPNLLRLKSNFKLNPELLERVEIVPVGVGATAQKLWWSEERGNPGNALLSNRGTQRARVVPLDEFVLEHAIDRVDFIKVDVEGMELEVMRGAVGLLRRWHPILYFETLGRYLGSSRGACFSDFQKLLVGEFGYQLFRLSAAGDTIPLMDGGHDGYTVAIHPQKPLVALN